MTMRKMIPPGMKRNGALGQMDSEFEYGPSPLPVREIPIDLLPKYIIERGKGAVGGGGGGDLSQLIEDVHAIAGVLRLERGLLGRVVTLTSIPQEIIRCQDIGGRGYLILNPAGATGLTTTGTLISSQTLVGATTLTSGSLGVANYDTLRFWVEASFGAGVGPVTFDWQTRNPVTGTYITSQTVFSLAATGNAYASVGALGVDTDGQMLVTVPAGTTITFSVGYCLKDGLEGTSAGASQTIFIGSSGVTPQAGYPILNGKEKQFYLRENVSLWGVTAAASLDINIFEL